MKTHVYHLYPRIIFTLSIAFALGGNTMAFPPAPYHEVYGMVRDEQGNPVPDGTPVKLLGHSTTIVRLPTSGSLGFGVNYSLKVPMDAGTLAQLYQNSALLPSLPFTLEVEIGGIAHLPIEVQAGSKTIGDPGERTRIDLTLGVDSDGDGLPDSWEQDLIAALPGTQTLADIDGDGDADGDGASNYIEYIAGTYAFDDRAVFDIALVDVTDDLAKLRFLAVKGRTYRLLASASAKDYAPVPFSLKADGSDEGLWYRADSINYQNVYVPITQLNRVFFQLDVQ